MDTSPITSWEGAEAFYTYFDGGALFWFWLAVVCCIIPIVVAYKAEQRAESSHE